MSAAWQAAVFAALCAWTAVAAMGDRPKRFLVRMDGYACPATLREWVHGLTRQQSGQNLSAFTIGAAPTYLAAEATTSRLARLEVKGCHGGTVAACRLRVATLLSEAMSKAGGRGGCAASDGQRPRLVAAACSGSTHRHRGCLAPAGAVLTEGRWIVPPSAIAADSVARLRPLQHGKQPGGLPAGAARRPGAAVSTGALLAWSRGLAGQGVRVAVLDTGLGDTPAPATGAVERSCWTHEGEAGDWSGHGSMVAAVAAGGGTTPGAEADEAASRCSGVAPGAGVLSLRVFARGQESYTSWIVDALNHALARGADVVNLSVGGPDSGDAVLTDKVQELLDAGVTVVSAIGNDGPHWGTLNSPADMQGVIGVGGGEWPGASSCPGAGSTADGRPGVAAAVSAFSSRGMVTWGVGRPGYGRLKPDLVAPARDVAGYSGKEPGQSAQASPGQPGAGGIRAPSHPAGGSRGGGCSALSGTSVSSPAAAGAAALAVQALRRRAAETAAWALLHNAMGDAPVHGWSLPTNASLAGASTERPAASPAVLAAASAVLAAARARERPVSLAARHHRTAAAVISPAAVAQCLRDSALPLAAGPPARSTTSERPCSARLAELSGTVAGQIASDPLSRSAATFESGAGLLSSAAAAAWARAYRPRAAAFPPSILLVEHCPALMPLCAQALEPSGSGPPMVVNLSLSNGVSPTATLATTAAVVFRPDSAALAAACGLRVSLSAPARLEAWSGWLGMELQAAPSSAADCTAAVRRLSAASMPHGRSRSMDGRMLARVAGTVTVEVLSSNPLLPPGMILGSAEEALRRQAHDAAWLLSGGAEPSRTPLADCTSERHPDGKQQSVEVRGVAAPRCSAGGCARQTLTVPFDEAVAEAVTPRQLVAAVDVRHSIRYPPAFSPRDDLTMPSSSLDWHGDHPHTNFRALAGALGRAGWRVEAVSEPWTQVNASRIGLLVVADPEGEWTTEERSKLVHDVVSGGLGLLVMADWYDERILAGDATDDSATRSRWKPLTGASNVPALNWLLAPLGAQFGGQALAGDILKSPSCPGDTQDEPLADVLEQTLPGMNASSDGRPATGASDHWRWARFASGVEVRASPPGSRVWLAKARDEAAELVGPSGPAVSHTAAVMAAFEARRTFGGLLDGGDGRGVAGGGMQAPGRVVLVGDSTCADESVSRRGPPPTAPPLPDGLQWKGLCGWLMRSLAAWAGRHPKAELPLAPGLAAQPQVRDRRPPDDTSGPISHDVVLDLLPDPPRGCVPPALLEHVSASSLGFGRAIVSGFVAKAAEPSATEQHSRLRLPKETADKDKGDWTNVFRDDADWLRLLRSGPKRPLGTGSTVQAPSWPGTATGCSGGACTDAKT